MIVPGEPGLLAEYVLLICRKKTENRIIQIDFQIVFLTCSQRENQVVSWKSWFMDIILALCIKIHYNLFGNAEAMAQHLRASAAFVEDLGLVISTQMVAHNYSYSKFRWVIMFISYLFLSLGTYMVYIQPCRENNHTY